MIHLLQIQEKEVSIVLTNDDRIHELNKIYRGKDRPTDVLAFAMHEGEFGALADPILGDVVVSVETARKQALSARKPLLEEVTMLLAHGLLHLLGWDHETAAKDRLMRAETARLCEAAAQKARSSTGKRTPSKPAASAIHTRKRAPAKGSARLKKAPRG